MTSDARFVRWVFGVAVLGLIFVLTGCSDKTHQQVSAVNKANIQRISNLYAAHQNFKGGKGPKDKAEMVQFIKEFDPSKLKMMGVDQSNPEGIFTSERDGKPFVVRWGVGGGRGSVDPVAFEAEGKDGKKQVGFTGGKVEDVDDATYKTLMAGKGGGDVPTQPSMAGRPSFKGPPPGAPTGPPPGSGPPAKPPTK